MTNMKRVSIIVLCLGLLAAACSSQQATGPSTTASAASSEVTSSRSPNSALTSFGATPSGEAPSEETPAPGGTTLEVWFSSMVADPAGGSGGPFVFVAHRSAPETATPGRAAMEALLQGPTTKEKKSGLTTAIPAGTRLLGLSIKGGTATVDLTGQFESGGGSTSVFMRLAQVVYTLTQFPTVARVEFMLDGKSVRVFSGEGLILNHPSTRKNFLDQLPPILVESPGVAERISSPVTVSGTANAFEGTVSIRVLDENGHVVASTFTTATCGSGCRGSYEKQVRFDTNLVQEGAVEVFEASAKNGDPTNVVTIPVTLVP